MGQKLPSKLQSPRASFGCRLAGPTHLSPSWDLCLSLIPPTLPWLLSHPPLGLCSSFGLAPGVSSQGFPAHPGPTPAPPGPSLSAWEFSAPPCCCQICQPLHTSEHAPCPSAAPQHPLLCGEAPTGRMRGPRAFLAVNSRDQRRSVAWRVGDG